VQDNISKYPEGFVSSVLANCSSINLRMFIDRGALELYINEGEATASYRFIIENIK